MTSASLCGQSSAAATEARTTPDDGSGAWTLTETHATLGSAGPEWRNRTSRVRASGARYWTLKSI